MLMNLVKKYSKGLASKDEEVSYTVVMDTITILLEGSPANVKLLRNSYDYCLFTCDNCSHAAQRTRSASLRFGPQRSWTVWCPARHPSVDLDIGQ
jgi:hypothetical protein